MSDMPEAIRERIESLRSKTQFAEILQAGEEWCAGNLIPADELQPRIDAAVAEAVERERSAFLELYGYAHDQLDFVRAFSDHPHRREQAQRLIDRAAAIRHQEAPTREPETKP